MSIPKKPKSTPHKNIRRAYVKPRKHISILQNMRKNLKPSLSRLHGLASLVSTERWRPRRSFNDFEEEAGLAGLVGLVGDSWGQAGGSS